MHVGTCPPSRRLLLTAATAMQLRRRPQCAKFDAHLHVWASKEDAASGKFPYATSGHLTGARQQSEPPMPGNVEVLFPAMQAASVSGAMIIQPGNHLYDHSYVTSVLKAYGDQFVGALLANPTTPAGVEDLTRLICEDGYRAVRFNPYLWPSGENMTNSIGRAMYARAGELHAPVGHMPFKGLLQHIKEIETLCKEYPHTTCIIDHMGFCSARDPDSAEWQALISLSKFPQVYVKMSAFFRVTDEDFPYPRLEACVKNLLKAFGAQRLMWGSDFPWVTEQCMPLEYCLYVPQFACQADSVGSLAPKKCPNSMKQHEAVVIMHRNHCIAFTSMLWIDINQRAGGYTRAAMMPSREWMTHNEYEWVMGKTLLNLFPGSFGQG